LHYFSFVSGGRGLKKGEKETGKRGREQRERNRIKDYELRIDCSGVLELLERSKARTITYKTSKAGGKGD